MYLQLDSSLLDATRAACVALPAAGLPRLLGRLRSRGWALVGPGCMLAAAGGLALWSPGAQVLAWTALLLVPPGCALALGWAAHGARPWLAVLAVPLLAVALAAPDDTVGQCARVALVGGAAVTSARLLAGAAPLVLVEVALVAMAVTDASFIFGHLADRQNDEWLTAVAAPGLPQLQTVRLGTAGCDFADFFAAALAGAILARRGQNQLLAAVATFAATQVFNQLFAVVDLLPATVPPAFVMVAFVAWDRRETFLAGRERPARAVSWSPRAPASGRRRR